MSCVHGWWKAWGREIEKGASVVFECINEALSDAEAWHRKHHGAQGGTQRSLRSRFGVTSRAEAVLLHLEWRSRLSCVAKVRLVHSLGQPCESFQSYAGSAGARREHQNL